MNSEKHLPSLNCSEVNDVERLRSWQRSKAAGMKTIDMIDRSYLLMSPLRLDEFCNRIYRGQFGIKKAERKY